MDKKGSGKFARGFIIITLLCLIGVIIFLLARGGGGPTLVLDPAGDSASFGTIFTVKAASEKSGLVSLGITLEQNGRKMDLSRITFTDNRRKHDEIFRIPRNAGLKDGPCTIEITAKSRSMLSSFGRGKASLTRKLNLVLTPPSLSVTPGVHNVNQGGSAAVSFTVSRPVARAGVMVGNAFFPAFRQKNGVYVCFFAFPYGLAPADFHPKVVVGDKAGNTTVQSIAAYGIPRVFKSDKINVPDSFLNAKMSQYASLFPAGTAPIEMYKSVNRNLRGQNVAQLLQIGKKTSPSRLWSGPFLRLPNAAKRAGFGDQRDYYYNGQKIDHETHLGVDLASVAGAPVPAANGGTVVHAGFFGIYGNCIIIDHGEGLQSLYSHLSQIAVQKGQAVKCGQIIGHTGATGLAGGDHLHFGMLLSGIQVNPVEWWDAHWIHDNILRFIAGDETVPAAAAAQ